MGFLVDWQKDLDMMEWMLTTMKMAVITENVDWKMQNPTEAGTSA